MSDAKDCPFTILIDKQEKKPFTFEAIKGDSRQQYKLLNIPTESAHLGAGMGDYSIKGYEGRIHIERKSCDDFIGTLLGYGVRWNRFERELANLEQMEEAAVVVECSLEHALDECFETAHRSVDSNRKTVFRKYLALSHDYRVPWHFLPSRQHAEKTTFLILQRWWRWIQKQEA